MGAGDDDKSRSTELANFLLGALDAPQPPAPDEAAPGDDFYIRTGQKKPVGFVLLGPAGAETRVLVHGCGYSIAIPGRPSVSEAAPARPACDVAIALADLDAEIALRLDELPAGSQPGPLAAALVLAHGSARATATPKVGKAALAVGASAAASCIYPLADGRLEYLAVTVRERDGGLWALYLTVRYATRALDPVRWIQLRTALFSQQAWDPMHLRTQAPPLFPASDFALPGVALRFTDGAWADAQSKAADLGPLTDDETNALIRRLIASCDSDDPPVHPQHAYVLDLIGRQLAMAGPARAIAVLSRNLSDVKSAHDLRAWCWQCIWAIGNRADRG